MVTDDMVALVPQLHTFARSLTRDGTRADDLVQEALARAIHNIERFRPGTNLKAWLFTIVRNEHYSQLRRRKFEAHGVDTDLLPEPSVPPDHDGKLEMRDLNRALQALSPGQRTALIPGERQRLLVRRSRRDLRLRCWNDQEPRGPCPRNSPADAGRQPADSGLRDGG